MRYKKQRFMAMGLVALLTLSEGAPALAAEAFPGEALTTSAEEEAGEEALENADAPAAEETEENTGAAAAEETAENADAAAGEERVENTDAAAGDTGETTAEEEQEISPETMTEETVESAAETTADESADTISIAEKEDSALEETAAAAEEEDAGASDETAQTGDSVVFATSGTTTTAAVSGSSDGMSVSTDSATGITTVSITKSGSYTFSGTAKNTVIVVDKKVTGVTLNLSGLKIDDSGLGAALKKGVSSGETAGDSPVITIGKNGSAVIKMTGNNSITGSSSYNTAPEAVIKASAAMLEFAGSGSLTVKDGMGKSALFADEKGVDPADGISAKEGELIFSSGEVTVESVNGSGVKAKQGTITVDGGTVNVSESYDDAVKAKDGTIEIKSGTVNISEAYGDGLKAKMEDTTNGGNIIISGGTVNITDEIYGDGIQGENVNISGGTINVTSIFDNAAGAYYTSGSNVSGKNTITETGDTIKTERINVNIGDHAGIKAGTKEAVKIYKDLQASGAEGAVASTAASGGLVISGGTVNIDTLGAGLKANKITTSGYTACSNGVYIAGSPDDALHSNNDLTISGGTVTINSSDDGITAANALTITGDAKVEIQNSFEGMEAAEIVIGTKDSASGPSVTINSDDDGINAAKKTGTTYTYDSSTDEDCNYTKTTIKSGGNSCTVYSGAVTVKIDSVSDKSRTLRNGSASSTKTLSYTADGDGIDCNGTLDLEGGSTFVFGSNAGGNAPIDTDSGFTLAENAIVLATGSAGMSNESIPEYGNSRYLTYGAGAGGNNPGQGGSTPPGQSGGFGGNGGSAGGFNGSGFNGGTAGNSNFSGDAAGSGASGNDSVNAAGGPQGAGSASSASISANSAFKVVSGTTTLIEKELPYAASFLLYGDSRLGSSGNSVTIGSTTQTLSATSLSGTNSGTTVSSLSVSPATKTMEAGESCSITATVGSSSGSSTGFGPGQGGQPGQQGGTNTVTWSSSNTNVAIVAAETTTTATIYAISGTAAGSEATITASCGGKTATCTVTVIGSDEETTTVPVTGITLNESALSLEKGSSKTLTATVLPENATDPSLTWSSGNEAAATVSSSGKVTAVAAGEAIITAAANDGSGIKATCTVTVTETPDESEEEETGSGMSNAVYPVADKSSTETAKGYTVDMVKGQKYTFGAGTWTSGNTSVLSVNKKTGLATAKKAGKAELTGKVAENGEEITKTYKITVSQPALSAKKAVILVGEETKLTLSGTGSLPVSWVSQNPVVASVDEWTTADGESTAVITGIAKGSAKVLAYVGGTSYAVTVTVRDVPAAEKITTESCTRTLNTFQSMNLSFKNFTANSRTVWTDEFGNTLAQDNKKIWTVYEGTGAGAEEPLATIQNAKVTGLSAGSTTIYGKDEKNRELKLTIIVKNIPLKTDIYLNAGKSTTLKHTYVKAARNSTISWTTYGSSLVELKNTDKPQVKITAGTTPGTTTLRCTYYNAATGTQAVYETTVHIEDPALKIDEEKKLVRTNANAYNYTLSLTAGEKFQLTMPEVDQDVVWKSGSAARVFVDENGMLQALSKSSANVTTKINGTTVRVKVTVAQP